MRCAVTAWLSRVGRSGSAPPTASTRAWRRPRRLLASRQEFSAILAGNDLIALGALGVLAESGLRCPKQVSVVGFNDLPMVDKLTPPLTTVSLPLHEMGALAARMLLAQIDNPGHDGAVPQSLLGVELAVRGSTTSTERDPFVDPASELARRLAPAHTAAPEPFHGGQEGSPQTSEERR